MIFRALRALVYCDAFVVARYEYGVSSQPESSVALSAAPSSSSSFVLLGDLPEEEVAVSSRSRDGVRPQVVEALRERVHDLGEEFLVVAAIRLAPPRRIDAVERVRDVLALHGSQC